MITKVFSKVMWVGRATVFLVGLAVMLALVFGVAVTALAGTGVGATFNLGKINTVNAISRLEGNTLNAMLRINQLGSGTALNLQVQDPNKPPMTINSSTKVDNLNSDLLDGKSANELVTQYATVDVNGNLVPEKSLGAVSAGRPFGGTVYNVRFERDLTGCAPTATLELGSPNPGEIQVSPLPPIPGVGMTDVSVMTFNSSGQPAQRGFVLAVHCPG